MALAPALLALALLCLPEAAVAQSAAMHPGGLTDDNVPNLPSGPGTIRGRVVQGEDAEGLAGVPIALYSLSPDGSPGLGSTLTEPSGEFRFENVSNDPGVVYLLGARYRDVPFGSRVAFAAGEAELVVDLPVAAITSDTSNVRIVESLLMLEWIGTRLVVNESHHLLNAGDAVVSIGDEERAGHAPAVRARLPEGAREFSDSQGGISGGIVQNGRDLEFWGPVHPGEQELRYRYILDLPASAADADAPLYQLRTSYPDGTGHVRVLTSTGGPEVSGPGLQQAAEILEFEGRTFRQLDAPELEPGQGLDLSFVVPKARTDPNALSLGRVDIWVDADDTSMKVSADYEVLVDSPVSIISGPDEPLLRLPIPQGAEFLGVSPAAQSMGMKTVGGGQGLELRGPIPVGKSNISYAYRTAVTPPAAAVALHFDKSVSTLNVFVADTGVAIESPRMHRRRPFRSGTRLYLHNQAFHVEPGEVVTLQLRPLRTTRIPRSAMLAGTLLIAALSTLFVVLPLRSGAREETRAEAAEEAGRASKHEREQVFDSIRDLEDDYEAGKVDTATYEEISSELRAQALEFLRSERASGEDQAAAPKEAAPPLPEASDTDGRAAGRLCPGCGDPIEPGWQFCSGCGHTLDSGPTASEE